MARNQESPDHLVEAPKLDAFLAELPLQEKFLVVAGMPAAGCAGFLTKWFTAWHQSTDGVIDCVTDDIAFADSGTGGLQ